LSLELTLEIDIVPFIERIRNEENISL